MEKNNSISKIFVLFLVVLMLFVCYKIFKPYFSELFVAMILVTIFYTPYLKLTKFLRGRKKIAALIMCVAIALLVIIPLAQLTVYFGLKTVESYEKTKIYIEEIDLKNRVLSGNFLEQYNFLQIDGETIKKALLDIAERFKKIMSEAGASLLLGSAKLVLSLMLIFMAMYFFFVDGERMLKKVMHLTPLPNKYDREIFKKFKDVSFVTMISTFVTAIAQGMIGAFGFFVVGLPVFLPGVIMGLLSLLPLVGPFLLWLPVSVYLLIIGKLWQGIFLIIWGAVVVSTSDNIIRAYMIKGKAAVNPIFIIFSIFGGITLFGFWGIIFGPLIVALTVTVFHIYELEYANNLDKK